jgi:hypothetical protein
VQDSAIFGGLRLSTMKKSGMLCEHVGAWCCTSYVLQTQSTHARGTRYLCVPSFIVPSEGATAAMTRRTSRSLEQTVIVTLPTPFTTGADIDSWIGTRDIQIDQP